MGLVTTADTREPTWNGRNMKKTCSDGHLLCGV
jgi:hypothetical protein